MDRTPPRFRARAVRDPLKPKPPGIISPGTELQIRLWNRSDLKEDHTIILAIRRREIYLIGGCFILFSSRCIALSGVFPMASRITTWIKSVKWGQLLGTGVICMAGVLIGFILISFLPIWDRAYIGRYSYNLVPAFFVSILVIGPAAALKLRDISRRRRDAEEARRKSEFHPSEHPLINAITLSLKNRARRLHFQAQLVLFLILATLGAGIYVFATAEQLTETPITRIAAELDETHSRLATLSGDVRDLAAMGAQEGSPITRVVTREFQSTLALVQGTVESTQKTVVARADDFTTSSTISTLSTRVGVVLLILFLVQILVTMYRYNSRLAAHLEGRAVALQLASLQQDQKWQITELINQFSGDSVDFGKLPPTAVQTFADILKQAAATAGKTTPPG